MKNKLKFIWDEYLSGPCTAFYNHRDFEDASPPAAIFMFLANILGIFLFFGLVLICIIIFELPKILKIFLPQKPYTLWV
jgi:hypothetical protein